MHHRTNRIYSLNKLPLELRAARSVNSFYTRFCTTHWQVTCFRVETRNSWHILAYFPPGLAVSDLLADGYTEDEVVYIWASEPPVKKYKDITMAQFNLTDIVHGRRRTDANHGHHTTTVSTPRDFPRYLGIWGSTWDLRILSSNIGIFPCTKTVKTCMKDWSLQSWKNKAVYDQYVVIAL